MKSFLEKIIAVFFVLCIGFIPLNFDGKCLPFQITKFLFENLIRFLQNHFFQNALKKIDFSSDSISLNLLIFVLFFLAIVIVLVLKLLGLKTNTIVLVSRTICTYYIIYILLKYGFDKIFKVQFYLPEPNILYSKFGNLSKDILYWSTIGTSRSYCVSLGIIEVLTAVLILIKQTRVLGMLFAITVFINIILVNFGFDISVKTFSILLLLTTIYTVFNDLKGIFNFLILKKQGQILSNKITFFENNSIKNGLKMVVIGLLFIQVLYPYILAQNYNDDAFPRPFLHGAYEVIKTNQKSDDFQITQFFIHRKKYLIFEDARGKNKDYYFEINNVKKEFKIFDYHKNVQIINYIYSEKDSTLQLKFNEFTIVSKAMNWKNLPVMQNDFHFTIDEIK